METKHRMVLERLPGTRRAPPLDEGYYGPHDGALNGFIYGRVTKEAAFEFSTPEAFRVALRAKRLGYPCRCEPPITVTF